MGVTLMAELTFAPSFRFAKAIHLPLSRAKLHSTRLANQALGSSFRA
jgi:hypothetical protein